MATELDDVQPRVHEVGIYRAHEAGDRVEFYDAEVFLFSVPVEAAASEARRAALVEAYEIGVHHGKVDGRHQLQHEFRKLIGFTT